MYHLHVQAVGQDRHQGRGVDQQDLGGHRLLVRAESNNVILLYFYIVQGVPQLSIHLVSVIFPASTHPNCKSWGSFDKVRTFATL